MSDLSNFSLDDPYADCQHVFGGVWGNHITFMGGAPEINTEKVPVEDMKGYRVYGHQPAATRAKNGDFVTIEYGNYWLTFQVCDIEYKHDPSDMFFANVDLVRICDKSDGACIYLRADEPANSSWFLRPVRNLMNKFSNVFQKARYLLPIKRDA